jgi:hypothetical protein
MASVFTCRPEHVPKVKFHEVYYVDKLVRMDKDAATRWVRNIITTRRKGGDGEGKAHGSITMPCPRSIVFQHNIPMGTTQHIFKAVTGRIPDRMSIFFVENEAWRAGNCEKNPCYWPYMGQTEVYATFGERKWPEQKPRWEHVPGILPGARVTDEQKDDLLRMHWPKIKKHMSVHYPHDDLVRLNYKYRDFVGPCNVWSIDFTPLGESIMFEHVKWPNYQGYVELTVKFARATPNTKTFLAICVCDYSNSVDYSVPDFTVKADF